MAALTPRQRQVLMLVARGTTNAAIGRRLGISTPTVQRHLAEVYAQLGATDRAHAVALALVAGEIEADEVRTSEANPRKLLAS